MSKIQAITLYETNQYNDAIEIFSKLVENKDEYYINLCNRAACYIKQGKYREALDDSKEVVRNNPKWAKAWGRLAASLYGLSQYDNALKSYKKALELEPTNTIYKNMIDKLSTNTIVSSIISSNDMKELLNDNNFKLKVLSYSGNPLGVLKDKEIMNKLNIVLEKLEFIKNL